MTAKIRLGLIGCGPIVLKRNLADLARSDRGEVVAVCAATEPASGFSTRTCLPAASAARASGKWVASGVAIATASTAGSAIRSSADAVVRTQGWKPATARRRASSRSATTATWVRGLAVKLRTRLGPQ